MKIMNLLTVFGMETSLLERALSFVVVDAYSQMLVQIADLLP